MTKKTSPDPRQSKAHLERELRIHQQIAFASGLFQGDVTIRTLLASLAEGVVIIDNSGTILLVNTAAEKMFDYPKDELVGKPHALLIPERFRKVHEKHEADYFKKPKIRPMGELLDLYGRRRDGSEFPVEISLSFIETINGLFVMAFVSDISLRKEYEEHLRESDELFRIQVECVQDYAIFTIDAEGKVLNWNAGAERMKGYRSEEIIGGHFSCFYIEEERKGGKPAKELKKAAAEGRAESKGWRVRKDGSRFWADVLITALRDEHGKLRGFSCVTHDITDRKRAEEALRLSEARYRALYRDNPTMIFTLDAAGTILSVNPFGASQLGYTIDELEGQPVLTIFHDDDRPAVADQLRMCLQNPDQVFRWQFRKVRRDGGLLWVEEIAQAVYDLTAALNVLVVCQDITERRQAEEALKTSEEKLRYASMAADIGLWHWDLVNNELTWSDRCKELFGYPPDYPMTYEAFLQPIHEEDRQRIDSAVRQALQEKMEYFVEMRVVLPDSQMRWVMSKGRGFYDKEGKPVRMHGIAMDVTERKHAEEALRKSELKLSRIFHSAPALIGIATLAEGRFIDINEAGLRVLGYRREEVIGRTSLELGIWESKAARDQFVRLLEEQGAVSDLEANFRGKNGKAFTGLMSAELIDFNGERYILGMVKDITERKRAEEEIARLNRELAARAAELEAANQELEAFNYTVAHDLRKPLTVVNGYCQVIREMCGEMLNEQCAGYLQDAYDGTLRMNRLIEALLNFSRTASCEIKPETADLSAMAREIAAELRAAEPQRPVALAIAEGVTANCDPALLRVVLENLLGNAWKYTSMREDAVIEFGRAEIGGMPACFVRDNGPGFDMAHAEKLFLPFQRLPGVEEFRGHGIGLATVQRIIQRHGGRVWAEGEPDKGATFWFTLP